jgi:hypothetical protein
MQSIYHTIKTAKSQDEIKEKRTFAAKKGTNHGSKIFEC